GPRKPALLTRTNPAPSSRCHPAALGLRPHPRLTSKVWRLTLASPVARTTTSASRNAVAIPANISARSAARRFLLLTGLKERVNKWRDRGEFRDRDQRAQDDQRADQGHEPEFLSFARKAPQVLQQIEHLRPTPDLASKWFLHALRRMGRARRAIAF